ncbi:MAG: hypothetical protein JW747_09590 [Candidatus Aminicenantes bacterium]|nr:hypothetical protein [Candidatus Aminicenantes bacterium]
MPIALLILSPLLWSPHRPPDIKPVSSLGGLLAQENVPGQKPAFDYMSSYLSRNTNPLGLEQDKEILDLKLQPPIKWAVRASRRHALR